jgi:hypothetical protein
MQKIDNFIWKKRPGKRLGRRAKNCTDGWTLGFRVRHDRKETIIWIHDMMVLDDELAPDSIPKHLHFLSGNAITMAMAVAHVFLQRTLSLFSRDHFRDRHGDRLLYAYNKACDLGHKEQVDELAIHLIQKWKGEVRWFTPKSKQKESMSPFQQDLQAAREASRESQPSELQTVLDLNKRLLYEIKQIKEKIQTLETKLDALAYGGFSQRVPTGEPANRPVVVDSDRHLKADEVPVAPPPGVTGVVPNATPSTAQQLRQPTPRPSGATGELGLVSAKAAPGTRPQGAVQRHKVNAPKPGESGVEIKNPSAFGDAMAFEDMMDGK